MGTPNARSSASSTGRSPIPTVRTLARLPKVPTDGETRFQFVRAAMVVFSTRFKLDALAERFRKTDRDEMFSLMNIFCHVEEFYSEYFCDDFNEALRRVRDESFFNEDGGYTAQIDELRALGAFSDPALTALGSLCCDLMPWDLWDDDEFADKAWPRVCKAVLS